MTYSQWDIKEFLEIISKGINSVLMANPKAQPEDLQKLAEGLLVIYASIYGKLKATTSKTEPKTEPEYQEYQNENE